MAHRQNEHTGDPGRRDRFEPATTVWVLDCAGLAEVDRLADAEYGISGLVLMENASGGLARETLRLMEESGRDDVAVVCGPGNNGGDGYGAARHLANAGASVRILTVSDPSKLRGDARTNHAIARRMGIPIRGASGAQMRSDDAPGIVVDAIFGTGLARRIEGAAAEAVAGIIRWRKAGSLIVAADVPSGLDADAGVELGVCVEADLTVTFGALKPGFSRLEAQRVLGEVRVIGIGCPVELFDRLGERVIAPPGSDAPGTPDPRAGLGPPDPAGRGAGDSTPP